MHMVALFECTCGSIAKYYPRKVANLSQNHCSGGCTMIGSLVRVKQLDASHSIAVESGSRLTSESGVFSELVVGNTHR